MAYLILKKGTQKKQSELWRVVSSPLNSKGKCEFVICGNGRLKRISRLERDRSADNKDFDKIKRGDLIRTGCGDRISKSDSVTIASPFNVRRP